MIYFFAFFHIIWGFQLLYKYHYENIFVGELPHEYLLHNPKDFEIPEDEIIFDWTPLP